MDDRIEAVARAWCAKMGRDPDAIHCRFRGAHIPRGVAYWRLIATEAREAIAMQEAIAEVIAAPKTPTKAG